MNIWSCLICFGVSCTSLYAQDVPPVSTDSLQLETATPQAAPEVDTSKQGLLARILSPTYPNPEKAGALSFVLPGSGQIYNKRYWYIKVPVIYAGYTGLIAAGEFNRKERNRYQKALTLRLAGEPHEFSNTRIDAPGELRIRRDQFDKRFQLSYIGVVLLHFVQTLEAYTTAHLLEFDTDESLTISPTLLDAATAAPPAPGMKIAVIF